MVSEKKKALLLAAGDAGDAGRLKLKVQRSKDDAKHTAKNNAKNNAKVQERARVNAEMRMLENPRMAVQIQTVQEISSHSALILARTRIIPGLDGTMEELMGSKRVMVYLWLSSRAPKDEAFRWLTARGAHRANDAVTKGRNRPVLQQVEQEDEDEEEVSKGITMKQASDMGFSCLSVPLFESRLKYNAARVEESLQNSLQHHDLGIRLWRHAGMGSKEDKEVKEGQVWYVNITYMILGEVGDEVSMEKHQSKTLGKEVERVKTIRVKRGASFLK